MSAHPYSGIADYQHWQRTAAGHDAVELDPVVRPKFAVSRAEKVASAGSCFAQHVVRHLSAAGFQTLVSEPAPSILSDALAKRFQYGVFSTRSANIYTARQLRQLFERALRRARYDTPAWTGEGGVYDPFRPGLGPFASVAEMEADRAHHLRCVVAMMRELDVFVFTLGLTEAFVGEGGAVFPLAPGVVAGQYEPAIHRFHNFTARETAEDLTAAIGLLRAVNPSARVVLTVSPVPLMATAVDRHVLVSTTASKAALRVAAEEVCSADPLIDYFPSFEIFTAPQTRGRYFGADARAVTEDGVAHAMRVFLRHYAGEEATSARPAAPGRRAADRQHRERAQEFVDAFCDEEALGDRPAR